MRFFLPHLFIFGLTSAFSPNLDVPRSKGGYSSALFDYPKEFERAVDCANKYGLCDIDELETLAHELEKYEEEQCFFEDEINSCEKEAGDRIDLAEILHLQSEMQLRTDYLKNANLFASDVQDEQKQKKKKDLKDILKFYL